MSEDTIYDRVAKLEDDVDVLNSFHKNKLAKLEIKRVKDGYY